MFFYLYNILFKPRIEKKKKQSFTSTISLGSPFSNSYLSDHESSLPTISMHPHYNQQYRSTNNNNRGESNDLTK